MKSCKTETLFVFGFHSVRCKARPNWRWCEVSPTLQSKSITYITAEAWESDNINVHRNVTVTLTVKL